MQQFVHAGAEAGDVAYMPISGFTAVDLGYQKGDAVSNLVNRMDEPRTHRVYLKLFNQIWNDEDKVERCHCRHLRAHRSPSIRRTRRSASTS